MGKFGDKRLCWSLCEYSILLLSGHDHPGSVRFLHVAMLFECSNDMNFLVVGDGDGLLVQCPPVDCGLETPTPLTLTAIFPMHTYTSACYRIAAVLAPYFR